MLQRNFEPASKLMPEARFTHFFPHLIINSERKLMARQNPPYKYRVVAYGRIMTITVSVAACGN
jgi:hypothetical protein